MGEGKKKADRRRREEEETWGISNWSELCPDLLLFVFKRLSFTALNRARSVCSSWLTASRGCIPKRNQIPWLILFPRNQETKNNSSCVLFVPEDSDKVYKTRDLGVDFAQSRCLTACGSWLLMSNPLRDLYILNPLTGERIDLPNTQHRRVEMVFERACFWIDNKTKDYLVVWRMAYSTIFIKKRDDNKWHQLPLLEWHKDFVFNHKDQKLYLFRPCQPVKIWDFSGDNPRQDDGCYIGYFWLNHYDFPSWLNEDGHELYWQKLLHSRTRMAVTVSGKVLFAACIMFSCKTWHFRIYKMNHMERKFVKIKSLGDEALIYDMGITVVAKDVPGIKKNSIYFSGLDHARDDPDHVFVYDLTTHTMETLPQRVLSSIQFSDALWFFP